jgi:hypothetical protein
MLNCFNAMTLSRTALRFRKLDAEKGGYDHGESINSQPDRCETGG